MGTNVFEAGVTLTLVDKVSPALSIIAKSMVSTNAAAKALQGQLNSISNVYRNGMTLMNAGFALASPLAAATKDAMHLQSALSRVQANTNASTSEMLKLNSVLTKTADATGIFSKVKLADFASTMAESGISKMSQINQLLPLMAKAADITQIISKGKISADDSAHVYAALAHQFGRYDAAGMKPIIEAAVAMSTTLPGGLRTLQGMGAYTNIKASRQLGIDPVESMVLQAAIAQTSGGKGTGRGALSGAQFMNFLSRSMPGVFGSGLLSGKSAFSAEVIGLAKNGVSSIFKNGKMSISTLIDKLSSFTDLPTDTIISRMRAHAGMLGKKAPEELAFLNNFQKQHGPRSQLISTLFQNEYGAASTIAQLFSDPKFKGLIQTIKERVASFQGIEKLQGTFMQNLEPQLQRVQTNFQTLSSTIGTQLIPVLTPLVTKTADLLAQANTFAEAHPKLIRAGTGLLALASGALVLGGAALIARAGLQGLGLMFSVIANPLMKLAPLAGSLGGLAGFTSGLSGLGSILSTVAKNSLVVAGALTAVSLVSDNWKSILGFCTSHSRELNAVLSKIVQIVNSATISFKHLGNSIQTFFDQVVSVIPKNAFKIGNNNALFNETNIGTGWDTILKGMLPDTSNIQKYKDYLSATKNSDKMNEAFLRGHGIQLAGGKLPVLATGGGGTKNNMTQNNTIHVTVNAPSGNGKDIAHEVHKQIANTMKGLNRTAGTNGGGGSASMSRNAFGNHNF
jgi:hypothetical protein